MTRNENSSERPPAFLAAAFPSRCVCVCVCVWLIRNRGARCGAGKDASPRAGPEPRRPMQGAGAAARGRRRPPRAAAPPPRRPTSASRSVTSSPTISWLVTAVSQNSGMPVSGGVRGGRRVRAGGGGGEVGGAGLAAGSPQLACKRQRPPKNAGSCAPLPRNPRDRTPPAREPPAAAPPPKPPKPHRSPSSSPSGMSYLPTSFLPATTAERSSHSGAAPGARGARAARA
jgi:hypothetical protein